MGKSNSIFNIYLVFYNIICCVGWSYCLSICVSHVWTALFGNGLIDYAVFWEEVGEPMKIIQTIAIMEVLHVVFKLVKSPFSTTFIQVFSRLWVVYAIMFLSTDIGYSPYCALATLSWCLVEVPRYAFYATNILGITPTPLLWLRYSLFSILYPTGITGELGSTWLALDYLAKHPEMHQYSFTVPTLHISISISLYMIICVMTLLYIPGAPVMYMHMVKARKKAINTLKRE